MRHRDLESLSPDEREKKAKAIRSNIAREVSNVHYHFTLSLYAQPSYPAIIPPQLIISILSIETRWF